MARYLKRGIVVTLICLLILSVIPSYSFAQNNTSNCEGIKGYDGVKGYDYIYFGKKGESTIKWKVLSTNGSATEEGNTLKDDQDNSISNSKAIFMFSEAALAGLKMYDPDVYPSSQDRYYSNSIVKKMCDALALTGSTDNCMASFSNFELESVLKTTKSEPGGQFIDNNFYTWERENELNEDKFFLPSVSEITKADYGFNEEYLEVEDENRKNTDKASGVTKTSYYLRTTVTLTDTANTTKCCFIFGNQGKGRLGTDATYGNTNVLNILLAANLNKNSIVFSSAAESGKAAFSKVEENTSNEWKLTLKDDKDFSDGASIDLTTITQGKEVTVTHRSLSDLSSDYTNVTAAIYDAEGNLLYYGSVNDDIASTETKIKIPDEIENGTYTLKVFGEQWNGDKNTDYATATPFETALVIDSTAAAVNEVSETISKLPDLDKITLSDKAAVEAARKAYDALTDEQKAKVDADTLKKLTDAEAKIAELAKATEDKNSDTATVAVKKGTKFTVTGYKYTVTSNLKKKPTVSITGYKNKKLKKIAVPATVKYKNVSFKVTAITKKAFQGQKKAKSAVIGKNIETIGASAFAGDGKLKKITVQSTVLKKVQAKAFKGIYKKAKIKVPAKKLKAYKKILKGKGQAKTVKIVK